MVTIDQIKQLREETGISVTECKKALEESGGDLSKAKEILRRLGKELAEKRAGKETGQGLIGSYIHPNKKVGVLLDIRCESDFVSRSGDFQELAHNICLQIAAMAPSTDNILTQPWIKDSSRTIGEIIDECVAKLGEKIIIQRFERFEL
jgi:elongation factor Ts